MNKWMISVITAVALAASGATLAQDFEPGPGHKGKRPSHGVQAPRSPVEGLVRSMRHLDLTEEQKDYAWNVMHTLKADVRSVMQQSRANHEQLKTLVQAQDYDEKAVAKLAKTEGDLAAQRIMLTSAAMSKILGQLTDAQRAKLETMKAEREQRAKAKRGKTRGKPKAPPQPTEG